MQNKKEEICGSITVITEKHELKKIVVIQDVVSYYSKEHIYSKKFRLESLNGVSVYRTDDPDIFCLADGSLLKKRYR